MATSSIRIKKVCEWCGEVFYAQKVSTRYCSHSCNSKAYKEAARNKRIQETEAKTEAFINQQPIEGIKDKDYLSFAEAGTLLGISRQAVYKMITDLMRNGNSLPPFPSPSSTQLPKSRISITSKIHGYS